MNVGQRLTFQTTDAYALLCISRDSGIRLRDLADRPGTTERSAFAIPINPPDIRYIVNEGRP